jgi:hypothetical protein
MMAPGLSRKGAWRSGTDGGVDLPNNQATDSASQPM